MNDEVVLRTDVWEMRADTFLLTRDLWGTHPPMRACSGNRQLWEVLQTPIIEKQRLPTNYGTVGWWQRYM
jgi:hypothetical protein